MKRYLFILITVFLLLIACNLPTVVVSPTPDTSQPLSTAVARTLTAKPQLPPANTPEASKAISATPSVTPTSTTTGTPTVTATPTPEGYKKSLGTPVWESHLDNGKAFGIDAAGYTGDNTRIIVSNGVMDFSSSGTYGYRNWRLVPPAPQNFYLEGVFKPVSCSGNDQFGLVFRAPDYSSGTGYYFGITCNGTYSLFKWTSAGNDVVYSGSTNLIAPGINQTNRIAIRAAGSNFTFYANDKEIQTISDTSIPDSGHFGVFVSAYSGTLDVQLDNLAYWEIH